MTQCAAITKSGNQCKGKALENGFCFAHQEKDESPKEQVKAMCGHINKHNHNYDDELGHSVLTDIACTLEPGHNGPHSAEKREVTFRNNGLSEDRVKLVYWNDDAGTPADEIKPDIDSLMELRRNRAEEEERRQLAQTR